MKTEEFLNTLKKHPNKNLLFEYKTGEFVGANYHITEIKNVTIDSVDCGAATDFWKETIVQLWESPDEKEKTDSMSGYKALGILNKVAQIKPMDRGAEIKFEYSNAHFHTAQLYVTDVSVNDHQLIVKLGVQKTACKAKETCGVPVTVLQETTCCGTASGCC